MLSFVQKKMYQKFGAGSLELISVLLDFVSSNLPNLHKTSEKLGIGYRTIKDVALLFNEYITIDNNSDDIHIADTLITELKQYEPVANVSYESVKDSFNSFKEGFNKHNSELDHIAATSECCYKRALDLANSYDIDFCNFLFLGDHDLTSIAFGILCNQLGRKSHIVVIDVDENVLSHIKHWSDMYKLNIETYYSDFRIITPDGFNDEFDVIFTDPPYTAEGMAAFLSKANLMLKKNPFSSILISYKSAEQSNGLGLQVQKAINQMGLYIRELKRNYNSYYAAEALGYRSDLYICLPTANIKKERNVAGDFYSIYTHGSNAVEKKQLNNTPDELSEASVLKDKSIFYIGEGCSKAYHDKLKITQFLQQKSLGKFHISPNKEYVVDTRIMQDSLTRILLMCDFEQFYVVTNPEHSINNQYYFYSILYDIFKIDRLINEKSYSIYLFKKKATNSILANIIGKRAILRNSLVKEICSLANISQNDARKIVDSWNLPEIRNASLYFLPDCVIKELHNQIKGYLKTLDK